MLEHQLLNPYCDVCFYWMELWYENEQHYGWGNSMLLDWSSFEKVSSV